MWIKMGVSKRLMLCREKEVGQKRSLLSFRQRRLCQSFSGSSILTRFLWSLSPWETNWATHWSWLHFLGLVSFFLTLLERIEERILDAVLKQVLVLFNSWFIGWGQMERVFVREEYFLVKYVFFGATANADWFAESLFHRVRRSIYWVSIKL